MNRPFFHNIPVFKVTPDKVFVVELWNGDVIPASLFKQVKDAGFLPLMGKGTSFRWQGTDWVDGARTLQEMQIMRLA